MSSYQLRIILQLEQILLPFFVGFIEYEFFKSTAIETIEIIAQRFSNNNWSSSTIFRSFLRYSLYAIILISSYMTLEIVSKSFF